MKKTLSLSNAYSDLFNKSEYVKDLVLISCSLLFLVLAGKYLKINYLYLLGAWVYEGYLCLVANNVINKVEPVLDIVTSPNGIFKTGLKFLFLSLIYIFGIFIVGLIVFILFAKSLIFTMTIIVPLSLFIKTFGFLLFSENLKIKDGFNFVKAINSFKSDWKEYFIAFGKLIFMYIVAIAIAMGIAMFLVSINLTKSIALAISTFISGIYIFVAIYAYCHLLAQIYAQSLSKMKDIKND